MVSWCLLVMKRSGNKDAFCVIADEVNQSILLKFLIKNDTILST